VTFKPSDKDTRRAFLDLRNSAATSPQRINLVGVGTVVMFSGNLGFGSQEVGTTSPPQTVTLTNTGSGVLHISSVALTGPNAADFAIQQNNCPGVLPGGESCQLAIVFQPTATGTRKAQLSVTDDGGGSPQQVELTGTGT
jgi:hypothetical protein